LVAIEIDYAHEVSIFHNAKEVYHTQRGKQKAAPFQEAAVG
jgi:hypothetical protein